MIKITYQPLSRCPPIGHIIIARFQLLSCSTKEMDCSFMSLGGLESLASGSGSKGGLIGYGFVYGHVVWWRCRMHKLIVRWCGDKKGSSVYKVKPLWFMRWR